MTTICNKIETGGIEMKQLKLLLAAGLLYAGIPVQAQWMYIQSASYSYPGGNSFDVTNKIIDLCRGG